VWLHTPMVEEFIYHAPPVGCAMGLRWKRPERQPHVAPEQGEDDARPGGRRAAMAGRRHDGERGRRASVLGHGGDASRRAP
jgi:hypothetical protein